MSVSQAGSNHNLAPSSEETVKSSFFLWKKAWQWQQTWVFYKFIIVDIREFSISLSLLVPWNSLWDINPKYNQKNHKIWCRNGRAFKNIHSRSFQIICILLPVVKMMKLTIKRAKFANSSHNQVDLCRNSDSLLHGTGAWVLEKNGTYPILFETNPLPVSSTHCMLWASQSCSFLSGVANGNPGLKTGYAANKRSPRNVWSFFLCSFNGDTPVWVIKPVQRISPTR